MTVTRLKEQPSKWALWFRGPKEAMWLQDSEGCVYTFDTPESAERVRDELYDGAEDIDVLVFYNDTVCTRPFFDPDRDGWDFDEGGDA